MPNKLDRIENHGSINKNFIEYFHDMSRTVISKLFLGLHPLVYNTNSSKILHNLCRFLDGQEMTAGLDP